MPVIEVPVRAQTRRRVRSRLPAVIVLWSLSVLAAGWVASATKVGPVVHRFNGYHGIHLADVVLAGLLIGAAAAGTWLLLRPRPEPRNDADEIDVMALELRRFPAIIAVWALVTIASVWVAFETEIGPVLFEWNNHRAGRLGDLLFTIGAIALASWVTLLLLRPRPGARRTT
jgi:hypothetical protein